MTALTRVAATSRALCEILGVLDLADEAPHLGTLQPRALDGALVYLARYRTRPHDRVQLRVLLRDGETQRIPPA